MIKTLETIRASRNKLLSIVNGLTTDEMNYIPPGFNNNLVWQIGHLVVTEQILCYKLSGEPYTIDPALIDQYKNGSKPEKYVGEAEIEQLKGLLLSTIDQLETDLEREIFNNFTPYTISTYANYELRHITDVLIFMVSHDGLHYGSSLALKRLTKNRP